MNRSRKTADLASHGNIFVDIANDRVGIGSTIPGTKLQLPDSEVLSLGNAGDLQLVHTPSLSSIASGGVNNFTIRQSAGSGFLIIHGDQLHLRSQSTNEPYLTATNNGPVSLFYDNTKRIETTSTGAIVTGILTATSYVGGLPITDGANNRIITASSASAIQGEAGLTFDGSTLLNSGSGFKGITIAPNTNNSATLRLQNTARNFSISNITGGTFSIADGSDTRFTINSSGTVGINNNLDVDGQTDLDDVSIAGVTTFSKAVKLEGGLASLEVGGHQGITIKGANPKLIFTDTDHNPDFSIRGNGGQLRIVSDNTLSERLIVDNQGNFDIVKNVDVRGDLDVDGQTNLDDVSIAGVTTHQGLFKLPDSTNNQTGRLMLGTGSDLQIFHTGSAGEIGNFTGNLNIKTNSFRVFNGGASQLYIKADQNDSVILHHSNNEKFRTTNTGASVTGILTATSNVSIGGTELISNSGTYLHIKTNAGEDMAKFQKDGGSFLYFNNQLRLETKLNGIDVTGRVTASNGFYGDGANITNVNATTLDSIDSGSFLRSDATDTASGAITFTSGQLQLSGHYYQGYHSAAQNYIHFYPANPSSNAGSSAVTTDIRSWNGSSFDVLRIQGGNNTITWRGNNIIHTANASTELTQFLRTDAADTATQDITFSGGAGAISLAANSDIRFANSSSWTGDVNGKIQLYNNVLYISGGTSGIILREGGTSRWQIDGNGHLNPALDSTYDIGANTVRVRNGYFDTLYGDGSNITNISGDAIQNLTIDSSELENNCIITDKISNSAVTNAKIASVDVSKITGNINATTLDNIDSGSFIRSDTDDAIAYQHQIRFYSNTNIHSTSAYEASLEVYQGTAQSDAFMAFHVAGDFAAYFGLDGNINDFAVGGWSMGNNRYRIWHEGNDGSGSGLDADTVDGLHVGGTGNNGANQIVRTQGNGYIFSSFINTTSGDTGTGSDCKFYASQDNYIRYIDLRSMRSVMNVSARSSAFSGREDHTSDQNYWIGSAGWGTSDFDSTVWDFGSCFFDTWGNPSGQPSGTSHWTGIQSMHYTNASSRYGMRITCGAGQPQLAYIQGRWNQTTNGWFKLWNAGNDGSGSGLDADTLDGQEGGYYKDVPAGTVMVFRQNSAPTGWTKSTSHNNKAMRIVSGNVGSGGSNAFSTAFNSSRGTSGGSVSNHTLTTAQMPSHTHTGVAATHDSNSAGSQGYPAGNQHNRHRSTDRPQNNNMAAAAHQNTGSTNSHNHGFSNPSINLNVQYLDFIICTRS